MKAFQNDRSGLSCFNFQTSVVLFCFCFLVERSFWFEIDSEAFLKTSHFGPNILRFIHDTTGPLKKQNKTRSLLT